VRREAFFLDAPGGPRFCLVTRPVAAPVGALLFVPPFAEELNKSRRMAALGTRAFAERGWTVLQMDGFGCGDSAGDFSDVGWHDWVEDVARGWAWLRADSERHGTTGPSVLWSLRGGSLVAADWLRASGETPPLLMWQPVTNGKQHLTQFLRLKAANGMLAESGGAAAMADIRSALQRGETIEVAGYGLSPALAAGMDAAGLQLRAAYPSPVAMLEVDNAGRLEPSPALAPLVAKWAAAGVPVSAECVAGPAFWQTQEIETAPMLVERSVAVLERFVR